jgi:putative ABC transport system substrate-binding protein
MVNVIRQTLPVAKTIGTIYNASEANSVKVIEVARGLFAAAGLKLDEVTVASSAEVLQAAQALASRRVDAFYIQGDNTVIQGFDAVVKATRDAKLPLFVDDPDAAKRGALACVGLGYYRPGYAIAKPLARVLRGESPAAIPMENVSERAVWLDLQLAKKLGLKFPDSITAEFTPDR